MQQVHTAAGTMCRYLNSQMSDYWMDRTIMKRILFARVGFRRWFCAVFFFQILALGCWQRPPEPPPTGAELKGTVTLDGKPVRKGSIIVRSAEGGTAEGRINLEGQYHITNAPIGNVVLVYVLPAEFKGKVAHGGEVLPDRKEIKKKPSLPEGAPEMPEKPKGPPQPRQAKRPSTKGNEIIQKSIEGIPPRYFEATESELSTTISAGPNVYDVKMTTP